MTSFIPLAFVLLLTVLSLHVYGKALKRAADEKAALAGTSAVEGKRDILIISAEPIDRTNDPFKHTTELHFNGDWTGVKLCRGTKCVSYDEIFKN